MDKKNLQVLLIAVSILIVFIALAIILLSGGLFPNRNSQSLSPKTSETGVDLERDPEKIKKSQESSDVMSLLNQTPHYGENFAFFYDYDGNFFTLYINPNNISSGNAEFDKFLKENGVDDRSWIYDLRTVSVSPTPAP